MTVHYRRDVSGIPLYKRIAEAIRLQVQSGHLAQGDQLPAEDVLAGKYGVARMTVRQALQELASSGIVIRKHGTGTFVTNPKIARRATQMVGFHEDLQAGGLNPSSKVIQKGIQPASHALQRRLGLSKADSMVFIHRLRLADNEPAAVTASYFLADLCASLVDLDIEHNSLYALLERECHLQLGWVEQRVEARPATQEVARHLGVRPRSALMSVERLTYLKSGVLLGLSDSLYRSDRYVLTSVLYR